MRTTPEPTDVPLVLPPKAAPAPAPAAPSPVEVFNSGDWLPPGLAEKPAAPPPADPLKDAIVFMPAHDWDRYHDLQRVMHEAREFADQCCGIPRVFGRPA